MPQGRDSIPNRGLEFLGSCLGYTLTRVLGLVASPKAVMNHQDSSIKKIEKEEGGKPKSWETDSFADHLWQSDRSGDKSKAPTTSREA